MSPVASGNSALPILTVAIRHEQDQVAIRQRSRQIARLLGFEAQDQTRIATAVSEIARNAFRYAGGGQVEFSIDGKTAPQLLIIHVSDHGRGIPHLLDVLEGRYTSTTGMGLGIVGARRLMDQFEIRSIPGVGTDVWLKKVFPRRVALVTQEGLGSLSQLLAAEKPKDLLTELEIQNQDLLRTLDELRKRQEDLTRVNRELEDTNRGVVALYAELDEKADHLRRADELKSKFLSHMSHEFRSPLNSIIALSGLLLDHADGPLNSEQKQQVGFIRRAADDLYELVNDLLDLAKVEAVKVEVKPAYFEVQNLFGALRGMLRPLFLNQSVSLVFEDAGEVPPLYSDEGKISQILRNFISNALKFTERGEVRISAEVNGERVRIAVADTGIGIAPEDQGRIFQDFVQVDGPIQRKVKGTGLGLPLSKKLANLLRGDVSLVSAAGIGSTFELEIPMKWDPEPVAPPAFVEEEEDGIPVLVVENKPETLTMYAHWLRATDFRMGAARTVRDAEKMIASAQPAIIVLDVILDGEDSWNFLASLKSSPLTSGIPVLVVSAVDDVRKGLHLGANDYLVKPITQEVLLSRLHRLSGSEPPQQILIIDDDDRDRYLLKHRLRECGMPITEASSGKEGIAKAIELRPKIIFLDLTMPGMNGTEVLKALKADSRTESIPVVIHTSMPLSEEEQRLLKERAAGVLFKDQTAQDSGFESFLAQLGEPGRLVRSR